MERHLPYGIIHCHPPPDTFEHARFNPNQSGWYLIYLPQKEGRLSSLDRGGWFYTEIVY